MLLVKRKRCHAKAIFTATVIGRHPAPNSRRPDGDNAWRIVLAEPPFQLPDGVTLDFHPGKPLTVSQAKNYFPARGVLRYWPDIQVHSARFPYLGFVMEGAIDWRIGITTQMARKLKSELSHSDYVSLRLPAGTFFLMPPEVPPALCRTISIIPCKAIARAVAILKA